MVPFTIGVGSRLGDITASYTRKFYTNLKLKKQKHLFDIKSSGKL